MEIITGKSNSKNNSSLISYNNHLPVNESISYNGGTDVDDAQNDGGHVWVDARAGLFEDRHRVKHNSVDATELEKREACHFIRTQLSNL